MERWMILLAVTCTVTTHAQLVTTFSVDQPPQFLVDAGDDLVYEPGITLEAAATGGSGEYTFLWSPAEFLDDPTSATPAVNDLTATTLFTVSVTDVAIGCTKTDAVEVDNVSGIDPLGQVPFMLYPNPTDGLVRIHADVAVRRVVLRDIGGSLAMELTNVASQDVVFDVGTLPAGMYFMTIDLADGRTLSRKLSTSGR